MELVSHVEICLLIQAETRDAIKSKIHAYIHTGASTALGLNT